VFTCQIRGSLPVVGNPEPSPARGRCRDWMAGPHFGVKGQSSPQTSSGSASCSGMHNRSVAGSNPAGPISTKNQPLVLVLCFMELIMPTSPLDSPT